MLLDFPRIEVPNSIAQVCSFSLKNNRTSTSEIIKVIEKDDFLSLHIKNSYKDKLKKGNVSTLISSMGLEGIRNRLTETYIHHARYGKFQMQDEIDEVHDILDLENRFNFMFSEGNSRVFLLGLYLKLSDIHMEDSFDFLAGDFMVIPPEVDEILILSKSRSRYPDWLILITWTLLLILGKEKAEQTLVKTKGKLDDIFSVLSKDEGEAIVRVLLKYAYGISDRDFLLVPRI